VLADPRERTLVSSLATVSRAETGGQPLDVAVLRDGRVFAREWKTGELRKATLR
jgi:hypothetical protein